MPPFGRPDIHTLFHIDPEWIQANESSLRDEMYAALCDECRAVYKSPEDTRPVDRIDPVTGQVTKMDALWECIADHCGLKPGYITPTTLLTMAILRAFWANGNQPMSAEQLYKRIGKSTPEAILKVLQRVEIENGIVPVNGR